MSQETIDRAGETGTNTGPKTGTEPNGSFFRWGAGIYSAVTVILGLWSLAASNWKFVYLIDDPAIHLAVARNLAESGTWGIVDGQYQSASSSPVWTIAISAISLLSPLLATLAPLLFNVAASIGTIWLLGTRQRVLRPSLSRPVDIVASAVIVVVILFLPALTLLGMEHVLHTFLVILIIDRFNTGLDGPAGTGAPGPTKGTWFLIALATLVRFETGFVAVAIATALLVSHDGSRAKDQMWRRVRLGMFTLGAAVVPYLGFFLINSLMGQGFLPNSVLAKGQGTKGEGTDALYPLAISDRLLRDPLLTILVFLCIMAVIFGWRRYRFMFPCTVAVITTALHVTFADVGWFERYQAYLIGLCVYALFQVVAESPQPTRFASSKHSSRLAVAIIVLALFAPAKISSTLRIPNGVTDTYGQRYQAARFLEANYRTESIAISELGYSALLHDGPITDLLGLGDYEVLQMRRSHGPIIPAEEWSRLIEQRGVRIVITYALVLWDQAPAEWIHVGDFVLDGPILTALDRKLQVWAVKPDDVTIIRDQLIDFSSTMPEGSRIELDELADDRVRMIRQGG